MPQEHEYSVISTLSAVYVGLNGCCPKSPYKFGSPKHRTDWSPNTVSRAYIRAHTASKVSDIVSQIAEPRLTRVCAHGKPWLSGRTYDES